MPKLQAKKNWEKWKQSPEISERQHPTTDGQTDKCEQTADGPVE